MRESTDTLGNDGDDQLHQNQGVSWITFPFNTRNPNIINKISVKQHLIMVIISTFPSALLLRRPTCLASWALPPPTCPHDEAQTEGKGFTQEVRPTWPTTLDPVTDLWDSLPAPPTPR